MKIAIFAYSNVKTVPYLSYYIECTLDRNVEADFIYWAREKQDELQKGINYFPAYWTCKGIGKYMGYVKSTIHFYKHLLFGKYDKLIFLHSHTAVACFPFLLYKYKNKYIIDIRDFLLENIQIYRILEKKVISKAYSVFISSPGFLKFLPKYDYYLFHNYYKVDNIPNSMLHSTINISFIGNVRYQRTDKQLMLALKNDPRFNVYFIGKGANKYRSFLIDQNINNVILEESFPRKDTLNFYSSCDIVNNYYGSNDPTLDFALSNKFYYAIQLNKPILASPGTYTAMVVEKYSLGFALDINHPNFKEELLYKFYSFDYNCMRKNTSSLIRKIERDNKQATEIISDFLDIVPNAFDKEMNK